MKTKLRILAIIPARAGSKGIRHKNMVLLAGKPLIHYTIESAKKSGLLTRIILSSDDQRVIAFCKKYSIEVPFVRPKNLSGNSVPMVEVVAHALDYLKNTQHYIPDVVVLLQPTSPLRRSLHIEEALGILEKTKADTVVSVTEVPHNCNPYSLMRYSGKYLSHFKAFNEENNLRQRKPKFYARNGPAILAFRYTSFMKCHSMYGKKIVPYFMNKSESTDIDDVIDLKIAQTLITHR